jgi:LysR family transcriptional regulator, transcription activator of glutamate synthase operon
VAIVPTPRAGAPEVASGPLLYREIEDPGPVRELTLTWSGERRLRPAADLFRRHVVRRASAGRVPTLSE